MVKDKKEQLLKKATQLFIKKGYERTSMRDLAKAVGIQAPGIYYHFKSKEEIVHEINEESWRKFRELILDEMIKEDNPEEKLKIYIRNMINYQISIGLFPFLVDDSIATRYIKSRKKRDTEVFHLLRNTIRELSERRNVENPIDPTVAALTLYSMVSKIYRWYKPKGRIPLDELIEQIIRFFFHGFFGKSEKDFSDK